MTVLPERSIVFAPAGAFTLEAGPTSVILPFWMTMVWLGFGAAPVPSMMVTFVSATTGSVTLTYWLRTCCESFVAAWAESVATGRASWASRIANLNVRMAPPRGLLHRERHHHVRRQM